MPSLPENRHADASFEKNNQALSRYYKIQSKIYDLTRWSFLFGRNKIIRWIADKAKNPERILEVGCGTGKNLAPLAKTFREAKLTGIDLSDDMIAIASKKLEFAGDRLTWVKEPYCAPVGGGESFGIILFSYALTMFNPGWEVAIEAASKDLAPGGLIAVVDFHSSPVPAYKSWMLCNHVRMDSHLLPVLEKTFKPLKSETHVAYLGVWKYMLFLGENKIGQI